MNDVDQCVCTYPVQEQEFCCFIKEIGNSSTVFCGPEQDEMELELELFWKSVLT